MGRKYSSYSDCDSESVALDDKCDTVARICFGSGKGSVYKSNLSECGAQSQRLTSLLFSDSPLDRPGLQETD